METQKEESSGKVPESKQEPVLSTSEEAYMFDEPDDTLEEFDELGGTDNYVDPEVAEWDEHWDTTGWDDEDANDEFIKQLKEELEMYRNKQLKAEK